jgi:hypothetical protein
MSYYADPNTEAIGGSVRRQKQLVVALEKGFLHNEYPDIISDVLQAYSTVTSTVGV